MKVIIAGSRNYDDTEDFFRRMDSIPDSAPWFLDITEVVSGTARGTDTMGEFWADHFYIPVKRFPANWESLGDLLALVATVKWHSTPMVWSHFGTVCPLGHVP